MRLDMKQRIRFIDELRAMAHSGHIDMRSAEIARRVKASTRFDISASQVRKQLADLDITCLRDDTTPMARLHARIDSVERRIAAIEDGLGVSGGGSK